MQQNNFSYKTGKKEFVTRKNEKLSPAAFIIPTFFIYIYIYIYSVRACGTLRFLIQLSNTKWNFQVIVFNV